MRTLKKKTKIRHD